MGTISILHVVTTLERGGAERALSDLVRASTTITNSTFRHSVVCVGAEGPYSKLFSSLGVPVEHLDIKRVGVIKAVLSLRKLLKKSPPDIVSSWLYHADLVATIAWLLAGRPSQLIWNIRRTVCSEEQEPWHRKVARSLLARLSRLPALVIANSRRGVLTHSEAGYSPQKWTVIPNGVDTDRFSRSASLRTDVRRTLGILDTQTVFLCIGRLSQVKGQDRALLAFRQARRVDSSIRLVFLGRDFERWNYVFPEVPPPLDKEGVVVRGEHSDLTGFYSAGDVLILPSRAEGHPQVVNEALSSSLPVIAFDVGDVREIVGDAGIVVSSLGEFAKEMIALSSASREEISERSRQARSRVQSHYSIHESVAKFESAFRELVGGSSFHTSEVVNR